MFGFTGLRACRKSKVTEFHDVMQPADEALSWGTEGGSRSFQTCWCQESLLVPIDSVPLDHTQACKHVYGPTVHMRIRQTNNTSIFESLKTDARSCNASGQLTSRLILKFSQLNLKYFTAKPPALVHSSHVVGIVRKLPSNSAHSGYAPVATGGFRDFLFTS